MLWTFAALWKHTESMYLMSFRHSPRTHEPSETPRKTSLHQPSTRADRSFGRVAQASASHRPSDSHSPLVSARAGSLEGWLAATPAARESDDEGAAEGGAPPAQAARLPTRRRTVALMSDALARSMGTGRSLSWPFSVVHVPIEVFFLAVRRIRSAEEKRTANCAAMVRCGPSSPALAAASTS
jgi:hypothetical protein